MQARTISDTTTMRTTMSVRPGWPVRLRRRLGSRLVRRAWLRQVARRAADHVLLVQPDVFLPLAHLVEILLVSEELGEVEHDEHVVDRAVPEGRQVARVDHV